MPCKSIHYQSHNMTEALSDLRVVTMCVYIHVSIIKIFMKLLI